MSAKAPGSGLARAVFRATEWRQLDYPADPAPGHQKRRRHCAWIGRVIQFDDSVRALIDDARAALESGQDALALNSAARKRGEDPEQVRFALQQADLQLRGRAKFGADADSMLFTRDGLEQATRGWIAQLHAERMREAGAQHIVDLGCGIGADSLAFARAGLRVDAIERDSETSALTEQNLRGFDFARVHNTDAEDFDLDQADAVWLDPARRSGSKRRMTPADWSPSLDFAFGLAHSHLLGVKLSPAVPHEVLPAEAEWQWVGDGQQTLEAAVYWGGVERRSGLRSAIVQHGAERAELTNDMPAKDLEVANLSRYLWEPHGAVIRAGLLPQVAAQLDADLVSPDIAYLTSETHLEHPFATAFEVQEVLPMSAKHLAKRMRELQVGTLEIKQRGTGIDPAEFRKRLKLQGHGSATLLLTRIEGDHRAVIAHRVA